jgi:hypothetical protein
MVDSEWPGDMPSRHEVFIAILFFPNLFLSLGCLVYSILKLANKQQRKKAIIVLVLSCIMPVWGSYEVLHPKWQRDEDRSPGVQSTNASLIPLPYKILNRNSS